MNSEKPSTQKSTASANSSNTNANSPQNACQSQPLQKPEVDKPQDEIGLHEFLDFLNVSCHVNEMISKNDNERGENKSTGSTGLNTKKTNSVVNFKKLSENQLVNELYGHKKASSFARDLDEGITDQGRAVRVPNIGDTKAESLPQHRHRGCTVPSNSGNNSNGSVGCSGNYAPTWKPWKKTETSAATSCGTALHPKLKEKLDFVINEGVLDSVLPFICPVHVSPSAVARVRGKIKESQNKKDGNNAESEATIAATTEAEKEAFLASGDTSAGMVKLKEQRSLNRNSKIQAGLRSQNVSSGGIDEKREPEVIIHVCDEVKNTSRDFSCPQSLLVSKMGYFADVTAGQKLDDMDISVHCDIHIFDWLMRWVKHSVTEGDNLQHNTSSASRSTGTLDSGPQLDATNVVPILVSASFLQMEPLFADCLSFCHARLSEIVRVSTNLSCLNDSIITCLAAMFTNSELEMVRDKKERVTPRLWTKLIQSLCEPETEALRGHFYSLAGLFRCSKCDKCLTNTMKSYISCLPSNVRLNRWGQVVSHHVRDSNWDINTYISQLFKEQKSWRKVYWKLWGHCHFLYCCTCETHFPVYQMSWCRYHPEGPNFLGPATEGRIAGPTGRYPCCGHKAFRFETMPGPNGCQFREHSVLIETDRERAILALVQLASEGHALCELPPQKIQDAILNGRDSEPRWSGLSLMPQRCRQGLLPVLNPDESVARIARRARGGGSTYFAESSTGSDSSGTIDDGPQNSKRRYLRNQIIKNNLSTSSDGCESDYSDIKTPHSKKGGRKRQTDTPGRNWSGELSARSNQDNQREFEEKVMKQVMAIVSKKIGSDHTAAQSSVPVGGTYVRLEAEWKEQLKPRNSAAIQNNLITSALLAATIGSGPGALGNKQKNK